MCLSVAITRSGGIVRPPPWSPAHRRQAHLRDQVRVLAAVGLLDPALQPRVAGHIHHRGEHLLRATGFRTSQARPRRRPAPPGPDSTCSPARSPAGSSSPPAPGAHAAPPRGRSPGCRSRVCSFTHLWIALVNSAAPRPGAPVAAHFQRSIRPIPTRNHSDARGGVEAAPWASVIDRLAFQRQHHLRDLLLRRHPREEVVHAARRREGGVAVVRSRPLCLPPDGPGRQEGTEYQQGRQAVVFHRGLGTEAV